jgi:site-specific DNA recombinase
MALGKTISEADSSVRLGPAVVYARVSSKDQEREGFSIPAQLGLLREYAARRGQAVAHEFVDVETAKRAGRPGFSQMLLFLRGNPDCRTLLVTVDELTVEVHFVNENVILSRDSRSSEKFMHGVKVLMAKNYIDNLSEETRKGMLEKAR